MKIKVGKTYKTRDGHKWHCYFFAPGNQEYYQYMGLYDDENSVSYSENGKRSMHDGPLDLVSEWQEPTLRPWNPDEIPVGALLRDSRVMFNDIVATTMILATRGKQVMFICPTKYRIAIFLTDELVTPEWTHSIDGGKTWHRCGVM